MLAEAVFCAVPEEMDIFLLAMVLALDWHAKDVSDLHIEASNAVLSPLPLELNTWTPKSVPVIESLADPVHPLLFGL